MLGPDYYRNIEDIMDNLGQEEILAQMAEEAAEIAQACLKLRRAIDQENPTPATVAEAVDHLEEEWADLMVCKDALLDDYKPKPEHVQGFMEEKAGRWKNRLLKLDELRIGDIIVTPDGERAVVFYVTSRSVIATNANKCWHLDRDTVTKSADRCGNLEEVIKHMTAKEEEAADVRGSEK